MKKIILFFRNRRDAKLRLRLERILEQGVRCDINTTGNICANLPAVEPDR
jgi:hypothetical protein|nr:MAG TPA: hypothetical protein [Caudoviricetes sp.]